MKILDPFVLSAMNSLSNQSSNTLANETAGQHYMRQFVDYLDNGIDFPELSQIRQLDVCLQGTLEVFIENQFDVNLFRSLSSYS